MSTSTDSTIDYAQQWQDDLATLGTIQDGSDALEYCFTNLLPVLCGYYESEMGQLSEVMNDLSDCQNYVNEIQAIFNDGSDGSITTKDAQEAIDDATKLESLLEQDEDVIGDSTVTDIETQLDTLFGGDLSDADASTVASDWNSAWDVSDADGYSTSDDDSDDDDSDGVSDTQDNADALQPYNDAFDAMDNDLSSMSSEVQSELQYWESCDQQIQGLISNMETQWANTEQVMVNNEITA